MGDLIDRKAAINALNDEITITGANNAYVVRDYVRRVKRKLENLPSEEPEIIHCRECKYVEVADKDDNQDGYTCQFHRGSIWFSGSYCSWAEKKENTNEDNH